jgi:hypothetical protein
MTDEQERKLYTMGDQKLLIELAIAYSNTEDADLECCNRKNILAIFKDLNLDGPCDTNTKLLLHCDGAKEGSGS